MSKEPLHPEEIQQIQRLIGYVQDERYYELFDVSPSASTDDIQNAYYKVSRQWHPDRFFRRETGEYSDIIDEIFMGITSAYRILSNIQERTIYDRTHAVESQESNTSTDKNERRARYRRGKRRRNREKNYSTENKKVRSLKEQRRDKVLGTVRQNLAEQKSRASHFFSIGKRIMKMASPSDQWHLCIWLVKWIQKMQNTKHSTKK